MLLKLKIVKNTQEDSKYRQLIIMNKVCKRICRYNYIHAYTYNKSKCCSNKFLRTINYLYINGYQWANKFFTYQKLPKRSRTTNIFCALYPNTHILYFIISIFFMLSSFLFRDIKGASDFEPKH